MYNDYHPINVRGEYIQTYFKMFKIHDTKQRETHRLPVQMCARFRDLYVSLKGLQKWIPICI